MLTEQQKLALLEKEYFHLQTLIEAFDAKSLMIKAWSVSLAIAIVSSGAFSKSHQVLLYAALAALLFWFIEAYWKTFQSANYKRILELEKYFHGDCVEINSLQISTVWMKTYAEGGRKQFYRNLFWPHVLLPHGMMFFGFLLSYALIVN